MNSYKAQHNKWHIELKEFFHTLQGDIPYCEECNTATPPIDMAHSRKRKDIYTREQYFHAAMLCRAHHNEFELGKTHEEMYNLITPIIERR